MILDAITESGATYRIDVGRGLWVRIKDGQPQCSVQRTWGLKVSNVRLTVGNGDIPMESPEETTNPPS